MSPKGYSQRSNCEPFTTTPAQSAPTPFPPPAAGGGGLGLGGWGGGSSYGRGSLPVRSFARRPHLVGKGGPPTVSPCGSQIPKFSTSSALPPSVRGGTSLAMCQPTARVQRVCRGPWGATTPGGEGNPNLSKRVAPARGCQPATRLSIGQRPKNMYCPRVAKFRHQGLVRGPWARL